MSDTNCDHAEGNVVVGDCYGLHLMRSNEVGPYLQGQLVVLMTCGIVAALHLLLLIASG